MKKIILNIVTLVAFTGLANAQVGIETTSVGNSAILDFPDNATKGILLPKINGTPASAGTTAGTFVFDHDADEVKYYHGEDGWTVMSANTEGENDIAGHDLINHPELSSLGVKIEDGATTAPDGVLSLESNTRALALPKVNSVATIPSPPAGMICYDITKKAMAVFDGTVWTYWN